MIITLIDNSFVRDLPDTYIKDSFQFISPERSFVITCPNGKSQKEKVFTILTDIYSQFKRNCSANSNIFSTFMSKDTGAPFCMNLEEEKHGFGMINTRKNCTLCGLVFCYYCYKLWKNQFYDYDKISLCIECFFNKPDHHLKYFFSIIQLKEKKENFLLLKGSIFYYK